MWTISSATKPCRDVALAAAVSAVVLLSGCGNGSTATFLSPTSGTVQPKITLRGKVRGGQQAISGATIQLYAIATGAGNTASKPLLNPAATSDQNGSFSITGTYLCPQYGSETYIVATGGNPGLQANTNNSAIALMAGIGPCTTPAYDVSGNLLGYTLDPNLFLNMDEVTTVASVYALAPFMLDSADVGDNGNPMGVAAAFNTINMLTDIGGGVSPGPSLPPAVTYDPAIGFQVVINTLADALAVCINSTGADANCGTLFNLTTTAKGAPADTIAATLALANNPWLHPAGIFNTVVPTAPFQPKFSTAPNDWTISLNYTGLGLNTPHGIAVDGNGDVWVANQTANNITEVYSGGDGINTPGTFSQFTGGGILGAQALAIDLSNNVWIANTAGSSVVELDSLGNVLSGNGYTGGGINAPVAIAIDPNGSAWVANFNGNSVTQLLSNGTPSGSSPITQGCCAFTVSLPTSIAVDANNQVWVGNSGLGNNNSNPSLYSQVLRFDQNGNPQLLFSSYVAQPLGLAVDPSNNVWVAGNGTSVVTGYSQSGALLWGPGSGGGISQPAGVAIDGAGYIWIANSTTSGSVSELTAATGVPLSPSGLGSLKTPLGIAVDASGNLWTANSGDNSLTEFVGIATPVTTPIIANTLAPLSFLNRHVRAPSSLPAYNRAVPPIVGAK